MTFPKTLADPLSARARLLKLLQRTTTRLQRCLMPAALNTGTGAPRPFFYYRGELRGESRGRALLCYLSEPFHHPRSFSERQDYSNGLMSLEIANALNRLGFTVDVVNYDDYSFVPQGQYDAFVGMTANFSRLLPLLGPKTKKIYWATRPDPAFEMESIRQRQIALHQRRKLWFPMPMFPALESAEYHAADGLLLIGNEAIRSTFRTSSRHVYCIDNPALTFLSNGQPARNVADAKSHFLYLCSWLLLRKGLDVTLEAFAELPHLHLWICGPVDSERMFLTTYRKELFHTPSIHTVGWVSMQSQEFARVCNQCAFLVFPSCAEGMSGSVINGMAKGLIPICTPESGVDLDDFGILIRDSSPQALAQIVKSAADLPIAELERRAAAAQCAALHRYTIANFRVKIESALRNCIYSC